MCKANFELVQRSDGEPINIRSTEERDVDVPTRRSSRLKRKRDERENVMRSYTNGRIRSLVNRLETSRHLKRIAQWSSAVSKTKTTSKKKNDMGVKIKKKKKKKRSKVRPSSTTTQLLSENERLRRILEKLKKKKRRKN